MLLPLDAVAPALNPPAVPHGTRSGYQRGCRSTCCRAANAGYVNERRRDGQSHAGIVSAEVAREVLRRYRARGIGDRRLAELAGISRRTVHEVIAGRRTWIRQSVENRILTMRPSLAPGALVSAWRANRALQAMDAEGYERSFLAAQTPHAGRRLGALVRVSTERALIALYRRLTA